MTAFIPEDIFNYVQIEALSAHPDGSVIACAVKTVDRAADTYRSKIWLIPTDGSQAAQLTQADGFDDSPEWSPDGDRLAFVSDRGGNAPQIFTIPRSTGEAFALSKLPGGVASFTWSPNGKQLLASGIVAVDPHARGERRAGEAKQAEDAPELIWRLPYKSDGLGYILDREIHAFLIDASTGEHRQLTDGAFDVKSLGWSPDGRRFAFTRTRDERAAHCSDVWVQSVDGGSPQQMTREVSMAQYPKWSPDGRWLVFSGSREEGDAQIRLWLLDMQTSEVRGLGDESIEVVSGDNVCWSEDSRSVRVIVAQRGRQIVAQVSVPEGAMTELVKGDFQISSMAQIDGRITYVVQDAASPNRITLVDPKTQASRTLHDLNAWWTERTAPQVEARMFNVPNGEGGREQIEGWLLLPRHRRGPVPLLLDVHGGPASYALLAYQWHPHWTVLCERGWGVLALNPVGSSSFGRDFAHRLRGRWGELDLPQHVAAVKALADERICDGRFAIGGKSYGGYLTAWSIGQTDLFRAALIVAPVTNLETHYGTSDSGYYADPYSMYGEPFIEREKTRQLSPMQHAEKASTPTLILQGKEDERCPKCQSEELYVTLMRGGETPTEMVLYPNGSHHFFEEGRPSHRLHALQHAIGWLEHWIDVPVQVKKDTQGNRSDRR